MVNKVITLKSTQKVSATNKLRNKLTLDRVKPSEILKTTYIMKLAPDL